ncbi:3-keto-5-aminohexanoate cleavage protein [Vibrio hepatarius]|uniref:3-keto-5-aminohexanoate cleavage protein n=1 Tax=Vibrio hepatarius TaxID=171383 RepID=UPI001C092BBE|nr:3-keto-5-aminohexanoate cleavage protein [Vibrio hepatarius]MBU2895837.1 3-keto-5-aminohexanoate cleavage protein [Vibrio hepatarius]
MDLTSSYDNNGSHRAIIVAPNGARKTKQDNPNIPLTDTEIIDDVIACRDAGAAMVHLHCRDAKGAHSLDVKLNNHLYAHVKQAVGDSMIVQLTTEAIGIYSPSQQKHLIKTVKPEAASFALRELLPNNTDFNDSQAFFHWAAEQGIISQIILYDQSDISRYLQLLDQGVLPSQNQHALIVLGRYQTQGHPHPRDLDNLEITALRQRDIRIAICAFGNQEHQCLTHALKQGMDVRVGFENNHLDRNGKPAVNNAQQVRHLKESDNFLNINYHDAYSFRRVLTNS